MNRRKTQTMNDLYFASASLLKKFRDNNSCSLIPENKLCRVMDFQNKKIIIVSSSSSKDQVHWITAYTVEPSSYYKENIYTYDEHVKGIIDGTLDRGYKGIEIISKHGKMVISGEPFTIKPNQSIESEQLAFF